MKGHIPRTTHQTDDGDRTKTVNGDSERRQSLETHKDAQKRAEIHSTRLMCGKVSVIRSSASCHDGKRDHRLGKSTRFR